MYVTKSYTSLATSASSEGCSPQSVRVRWSEGAGAESRLSNYVYDGQLRLQLDESHMLKEPLSQKWDHLWLEEQVFVN